MNKECMHVQFKNMKRSGVPAIERIEPFSLRNCHIIGES